MTIPTPLPEIVREFERVSPDVVRADGRDHDEPVQGDRFPLAAKKEADERARIDSNRTQGGARPGWLDAALRAAGILREGENL